MLSGTTLGGSEKKVIYRRSRIGGNYSLLP